MKHIHSFDSFLNEQSLNEIGEGVSPFPWRRTGSTKVGTWMTDMSQHERGSASRSNDLPDITYEFKSDKTTYIVKVVGSYSEYTYINFGRKPDAPKPQDYNVFIGVAFNTVGSQKEVITNFGEQFKVISTVSAILEEVMKELQSIEWIKVEEIHIAPKLEDEEEGKPIAQSKRGRLYLEYIKKQGSKLKGDWTADIQKDRFVLKNGKWSGGSPGQFINL